MALKKFRGGSRDSNRRSSQQVPLNYYRSRPKSDSSDSPFVKKISKKRFSPGLIFSRTIDITIVAAVVVGLIYSLLVQSSAVISVNSADYHSIDDYRAIVQGQLHSLKDRSKITFDEVSLVNTLKMEFPEIIQARVDLPFFGQKPHVILQIAKPVFFLQASGHKYIVDEKGVAVTLASNLPKVKNLPVVTDNSGFEAAPQKQVLSSQEVSFIQLLIKQCQRSKIPISALVLPAKIQELDLSTKDRSYFVKFYLGGDPLLQVGQFLAARHHFDKIRLSPQTYLDVRVSGKIYYK